MDELIVLGLLSSFEQDKVYSGGGICPTLKARDYKGPVAVLVEVKSGQTDSFGTT